MSDDSSKPKPHFQWTRRHVLLASALPLWVYLGFIISQLVVSGVLSLLDLLGVGVTSVNEAVWTTVIGAIIYTLTILIVIGGPWLFMKRPTRSRDIGLGALPTWFDILVTPLGFIAYLIVTAILAFIAQQYLTFIDYTQVQDTGFSQLTTQGQYILAFITLVVMAPVAEEVLFRGYLFGKLRRHIPLWAAAIVTSLLFGFVHGQWNVAIDTFALSMVMCGLVAWSGSLWPAILLHMLKNFIAFYFLFINPAGLSTIGG